MDKKSKKGREKRRKAVIKPVKIFELDSLGVSTSKQKELADFNITALHSA